MKTKLVFLSACFAIALVAVPPSSADQRLNQQIAEGKRLVAERKLKEAHKMFEKALFRAGYSREALAELGKIEIQWEDWGKANDRFEKILNQDKNDLEAHYYRGICYRETGKFKALLLRRIDFGKSEKHFERVLSQDSSYQDVVYQFAVLERYRDKYDDAVLLGHAAIRLRPELPEPQRGLFRLYRYFIEHTGDREALEWLRGRPWEQARYFIGEKHRRNGNFDNADSIFKQLLAEPLAMSKQPVRLSLARLYYQQNHPELAQGCFQQAVDSITSQLDADLVFEDVKYILTSEELHLYRKLKSPEQFRDFFNAMWTRRDPTPAATVNARLAEHYRRLLYAEKNFAFDAFRSWFNNPDKQSYLKYPEAYALNQEFNDKGLVYLRHGAPNETAFNVTARSGPNESWRYFKTSESNELTFHFVVDENASGNNWRLTPMLRDPDMLEARLHWGNIYHRLLTASDVERLQYENEMAEISAQSVRLGFESDRHSWAEKLEPLDTPYYTAAFRDSGGQDVLELFYGVPLEQLKDGKAGNGKSIVLEKGVAVHDLQWNAVFKSEKQVTMPSVDQQMVREEHLIDAHRFTAPPDSYHVAFHVRQSKISPNRLGGHGFEVRLPDFEAGELAMSDLVVAFEINPHDSDSPKSSGLKGKQPFVRNGWEILPNPDRRFDREKPVQLYFEAYNLDEDEEGKTQYQIEYSLRLLKKKRSGLSILGGLFGGGGKSKIALSAQRTGDDPTAIEQIALDLSKAEAGEYELTVLVTDRVERSTTSEAIELELY